MNASKTRIEVITTLHSEGMLAQTSLWSFERSRQSIEKKGVELRFLMVLDRPTQETREVVAQHPIVRSSDQIIVCDHGDVASSRNTGIARADGSYVCTLDGDDLISTDYFARHLEAAQASGPGSILHPEMVVSFGMYNAFNWQMHQPGPHFDRYNLLTVNPWISAAFARREVFEDIPYLECDTARTGFGYEDWHWNCETIARGLVHELAWGTIYFYRRKYRGSLNESAHSQRAMIAPTAFFDTLSPQEQNP